MSDRMKDRLRNFIDFFTKERLFGITLFCSLICFLILINLFLQIVLPPMELSSYNISTYNLSFFNPYKYITFFQYGISLVTIAIFSLWTYFLYKKDKIKNINLNKIYVFLLFIYTILLCFINTTKIAKLICFILVFIILLFFSFYTFKSDLTSPKSQIYKKLKNVSFYIVTVAVIVQFFSIFYPFVFEKVKIMNEFFDIPETYLMKNADGTANEVNTVDLINEYNILGMQNKYDIRNPNSFDNIPCFQISDILKAENHIKYQAYDKNILHLPGKKDILNDNYYFLRNNSICLIGQITSNDIAEFSNNDNDEKILLKQQKVISNTLNKIHYRKFSSSFSKDYPVLYNNEKNFIKDNEKEIHWQILNRYYIHHQNHIIAPVNEIMQGKDINKIFFQYGKFNALFLSKVFDKLGGFDFTKYMQVTYSFYYLYFIAFFTMIILFFRNKEYILSWLLLTAGSYNFITDEFLRIAPGINPMRHFFDIFILMFFLLYMKKSSKTLLILSSLLTLAAILNETMTGTYIMLSLTATLFVKNFIFDRDSKSIFEIVIMILLPVLGYICKIIGASGVDYAVGYFHLGLLGFPTSKTAVILCFLLISAGYVVLIKNFLKPEKHNTIYFYTACFFYVQALLTYYLWGSDFAHLLVYFPVFAFTVLAFLFNSELRTKYTKTHNTIISVILIISAIFCILGMGKYYKNLKGFNKIFKTHKTYEWTLPHTNFISTMSPEYFEDSIKLIQKYSQKDKGIYIISKYDSLLPVISERYSNMPFFEVSNFLTTRHEVDLNIKALQTAKPKYLFVDKDIDRDFAQDILWNEYDFKYLFFESVWRVQRLQLMKDIFNSVRNDYRPVESSYLLTVWKRKD